MTATTADEDPFITALGDWFDDLFRVAIDQTPTWRVVSGLLSDLNAITPTAADMQVAIFTLVDTAGELVRLIKPGGEFYTLRVLDDLEEVGPGWIHGARAIVAAANQDDITPFLNIEVDPDFAIRMLAAIVGATMSLAHTWLTRHQEEVA